MRGGERMELNGKEVCVTKNDGTVLNGVVTNENHVFIFLEVIREIKGGIMKSEEVIAKKHIRYCNLKV